MGLNRKMLIEVDEDISLRVSDILCWLRGYRAGRGRDTDDDMFFEPIIKALRDLNMEFKKADCNTRDKEKKDGL